MRNTELGFPCTASAQATARTKIGDCTVVHAVRRGKTTKAVQSLTERFFVGDLDSRHVSNREP